MQTYSLPKSDGTKYAITGEALTDVYCNDTTSPMPYSVIQLASGEKVLYVNSVPVEHSNNSRAINTLYRNAQDFTAGELHNRIQTTNYHHSAFKALGIALEEVIA